jgi:hypothetical protein
VFGDAVKHQGDILYHGFARPSCVRGAFFSSVLRRHVIGFGLASATLGVGKPLALAVHFQNVHVMRQPVEQGTRQALGPEQRSTRRTAGWT